LSAYADTSFLVSLYVLDSNSALAAAQMKHIKLPVLLTPFGEVELVNALYLRLFRKELVRSTVKAAHSLFTRDIQDGVFDTEPLMPTVYARAKLISPKQTPHLGTRTLDVLHVASALVLQADAFFTFDRNQEKLAKAVGLVVADFSRPHARP
jgi:predicted nucleic acid-binding protein